MPGMPCSGHSPRRRVGSIGVIARVALVPYPPLLVGELAPGHDRQLAELRAAVSHAVRWLAEGATHWLAVAADESGRARHAGRRGSFASYGADVTVTLSSGSNGAGPAALPLPVLMAGWLRGQAGAESVAVELLDAATAQPDCERAGTALAVGDETALLVLADGSTRHGEKSPGGKDDRAPEFDAGIADALEKVDADALARIDATLAGKLGAAGRAAWQVAGGVARARAWRGTLHYTGAPFGVGYHVATWEAR